MEIATVREDPCPARRECDRGVLALTQNNCVYTGLCLDDSSSRPVLGRVIVDHNVERVVRGIHVEVVLLSGILDVHIMNEHSVPLVNGNSVRDECIVRVSKPLRRGGIIEWERTLVLGAS